MFDLRATKATGSFEPMSPGVYMGIIESAEMKDTKAGNGQYVKLVIKVVGGEHDGRKVFHNMNVKNPNPEAVRIAMEQMKSMLLASGLPEEKCVIKDVGDFVGLTFGMKLSVEDDQNRIKEFQTLTPKAKDQIKNAVKSAFAGW
jgi:hypothetical protein